MKTFQENLEMNEVLLDMTNNIESSENKIKLSEIHVLLKKTLETVQVSLH